jgi:hypothetical protein
MNAKTKKVFVFFLIPFISHLFAIEDSTNQIGIQNWKAKNAKLWFGETGLKVLANIDSPRPVLTVDDVCKTAKFTAKISLRVTNAGTVGIKWTMNKGEKSERPRSVYKKVKPGDDYQTVIIVVPVKGCATDFRLLTPWGDSTIAHIRFLGGGNDLEWRFIKTGVVKQTKN